LESVGPVAVASKIFKKNISKNFWIDLTFLLDFEDLCRVWPEIFKRKIVFIYGEIWIYSLA